MHEIGIVLEKSIEKKLLIKAQKRTLKLLKVS